MLDARIDWDDVRVLDLYAGSGALGLEAFSRGATSVSLVESDRQAIAAIRSNVAECGAAARVEARRVDDFLRTTRERFGLILADPPYGIAEPDLTGVIAGAVALLEEDGLVVLERAKRAPQTSWPAEVEVIVVKNYGDTRVEVARKAAPVG